MMSFYSFGFANVVTPFVYDGVHAITQITDPVDTFTRLQGDTSSKYQETIETKSSLDQTIVDGDLHSDIARTTTAAQSIVKDDAANNQSQVNQAVQAIQIKTITGANNNGLEVLPTMVAIKPNNVIAFAVDNTGKILTNQLTAPGIHGVKSFDIPVYDNAGVIKGFIPVMN